MSKAAYLAEITEWARNGRRGLSPSPLPHGLMLGDIKSDERDKAEDAGDPQPPAVSNWIWWDAQRHDDLLLWHNCIRAAHMGGGTFTKSEIEEAEAAYRYAIGTGL